MSAQVVAVHRSPEHAFSKVSAQEIELVAGHGVRGDAHYGVTVKHRSRVARDPTQPNLRQVHLLHEELIHELQMSGFAVEPGNMGENVTTRGLPVLSLSAGTKLRIGEAAVLLVTGLRNPCHQIESFSRGLLAAVLDKTSDGALVRKAGVMCVVERGGLVRPGDSVAVVARPEVHVPLQPV
jgi:MOSC domain-containing protein YiiM